MILKKKLQNDSRGFLVLTMVLIVCAVVLAVATGVFLRSISDVNKSLDSEQSVKAWSAVSACGEFALGQMVASTTSTSTTAENWAYAGDETLLVGEETCYIYPVEDSAGAKLIKASSTVSYFTKKLKIEVATNTPVIVLNYWEEVADF